METLKPRVREKPRVNRLCELRNRRKLSQAEVSQLLGGITPAVVCRHENARKRIGHESVVKYARKIYKVDTYALFSRPGVPTKNRLLALRMRSRLSPKDVQAVTGIHSDHLEAAEWGEEGLTHKEIKALAKLYKVWSYELFQERIGGEDAWQHGQYWIGK
jgi:hypothetical protein